LINEPWMNPGWIKLHRKMTEWEWYTDHNTFILFMHLLLTVNYEDSRYRGHDVPRGSRVAGLNRLSEETGLSFQKLRTVIDKLKSTGEITVKSTNKFSIITICNFDKYQDREDGDQQAKQQPDQQTSNKRVTTSKEVKKERSKESSSVVDDRFNLFWEKYPKKVGKKEARKAWEKQKCWNGQFELIMDRVDMFASFCDGKDKQFIANPASWLNGERWNDEIYEINEGQKVGGLTF